MTEKKKILFIDKDASEYKLLFLAMMEIEGKSECVEFFSANTLEEGSKIFEDLKEKLFIVSIGTFCGDMKNVIPLVKRMREGFSGQIIGMTIIMDHKTAFIKAGCDRICSAKDKLLEMIINLLPA